MDVTVTIGSTDEAGGVEVSVSDDTVFTPEVCSDLLRRAADTALRIHGELHPTDAPS